MLRFGFHHRGWSGRSGRRDGRRDWRLGRSGLALRNHCRHSGLRLLRHFHYHRAANRAGNYQEGNMERLHFGIPLKPD
jgi:hypothetical protein